MLKEDDRKKKENIIGKVIIPMPDLTDGRPKDGWYALVPAEENSVKGEILLDIQYTPPVPNKNVIGGLKINGKTSLKVLQYYSYFQKKSTRH